MRTAKDIFPCPKGYKEVCSVSRGDTIYDRRNMKPEMVLTFSDDRITFPAMGGTVSVGAEWFLVKKTEEELEDDYWTECERRTEYLKSRGDFEPQTCLEEVES